MFRKKNPPSPSDRLDELSKACDDTQALIDEARGHFLSTPSFHEGLDSKQGELDAKREEIDRMKRELLPRI